MIGTEAPTPTVGDAFRRLTEGLSRLIRDHMALVRTELRQDLKAAGKDVALALAGVPSLLVGYALLMFALVYVIEPWTGIAAAFAIVGALNVLVGGLIAFVFGRRLVRRDRPDLDRTTTQLKENAQWLRDLRRS